MKIFVLHGDNTQYSYNRLQKYIKKAKDRGWEINYVESKNINIREVILGKSLFDKERLLIINDISVLDKGLINWLKSNSKRIDCYLIIYHHSLLNKNFLKSLPDPDKIEVFEIPKLIWSFLDSFFPGNAKNVYKLLHEIIKNEPPELLFIMLARQLRDIYWAKVDSKTMEYPAWRVSKLKKLASKFSINLLQELIYEMSKADIGSKTSQSELTDSLDFIMAKYLE